MNRRACLLLLFSCVLCHFPVQAMFGGDEDYSRWDEWGGNVMCRDDYNACSSSLELHQGLRRSLQEARNGWQLQPLTEAQVRALTHWSAPKNALDKDSWKPEELLNDPLVTRFALSQQHIKDLMLKRVKSLTVKGRYIAACCIAAGANPEKHATRTSWLSEAIDNNDVGFIQSIAHAKPNPNRRDKVAHGPEKIVLDEPLFFDAKNVEMAQVLLSLGADYQERGGLDNGTILHHLCTLNFGKPHVELLQFYLAHGADPNAVDDHGRTPLHVLGERMRYVDICYSIPCALMLLRYGAKPKAKLNGKTFLECIDQDKYQPKLGHLSSRLLYASMEQYLKPGTKRRLMINNCGQQSLQCACLNNTQQELMEFTQESLASLKASLPLVPEPCALLDCNQLHKHAKYKWWHLLKNSKTSDKQIAQEITQIIEKEVEPCFKNWQNGRTLAALLISIDSQVFVAAMKEKKFELGDIALLEDDVDFVEYMLRHNVHIIEYKSWARSVHMAFLLNKYYPQCFTGKDSTGGNVFHQVAVFGAIMDHDLPRWYYEQDVNPLCVNNNGHTPLELLAYYSYRYMRQEKKLIEIARILLLAGNDPLMKNTKTGKSPFDRAQERHALWDVPATGMLLTLLTAVSKEPALLKKVQVIETVSRQLLADLNPCSLERVTEQNKK